MASTRPLRIATTICAVVAAGALVAIWLGQRPEATSDAAPDPVGGAEMPRRAEPPVRTPDPAANARAEAKGLAARVEPLDARLIATVVRSDPAESFAAISRLDGSATELLSVGDTLASNPEARVTAVGDGFVDVDHAGTSVRLSATSSLDPLAERFLEAVRSAPRREISEEERERRRDLVERVRARMEAGPGSGTRVSGTGLFEEGRTISHWDGDRLSAIELDDIEPGSLYDAVGLRNGDRIEAINGIPLGDPDAARDILIELATSSEIVADVDRPDGPGEVSIPTEVLHRYLEGLSAEEIQALEAFGDTDSLPVDIPEDAIPAPPTD